MPSPKSSQAKLYTTSPATATSVMGAYLGGLRERLGHEVFGRVRQVMAALDDPVATDDTIPSTARAPLGWYTVTKELGRSLAYVSKLGGISDDVPPALLSTYARASRLLEACNPSDFDNFGREARWVYPRNSELLSLAEDSGSQRYESLFHRLRVIVLLLAIELDRWAARETRAIDVLLTSQSADANNKGRQRREAFQREAETFDRRLRTLAQEVRIACGSDTSSSSRRFDGEELVAMRDTFGLPNIAAILLACAAGRELRRTNTHYRAITSAITDLSPFMKAIAFGVPPDVEDRSARDRLTPRSTRVEPEIAGDTQIGYVSKKDLADELGVAHRAEGDTDSATAAGSIEEEVEQADLRPGTHPVEDEPEEDALLVSSPAVEGLSKSDQKTLIPRLVERSVGKLRRAQHIHEASSYLFNPYERRALAELIDSRPATFESELGNLLITMTICTGLSLDRLWSLPYTGGSCEAAGLGRDGFWRVEAVMPEQSAEPPSEMKPFVRDVRLIMELRLPRILRKAMSAYKGANDARTIGEWLDVSATSADLALKKQLSTLRSRHGRRFRLERLESQLRYFISLETRDLPLVDLIFGHGPRGHPVQRHYRWFPEDYVERTFQELAQRYFAPNV